MLSLKKDKKEEEDKDGGNPYANIEKTSVLQEARYGLWKWRVLGLVNGDVLWSQAVQWDPREPPKVHLCAG